MDPNAIALFRELADRSPAEREAYYVEHHVDAALRAEVDSLLRFEHQTADSLHDYVASAAAHALLDRRRLGVFEIEELLGVGGMGEVYRARDTRLGRDVAIKILTPALRDDPEHVRRFEREVRVLASLNHLHIGVVHGLEEVDGLQALVMELPGENLAERLARGPLPVADALDVARQVADALEAAHTQGIVHRDLKPANIKRRADGAVKVLDFGLAKTLAPPADGASITQTGTVAGTPAYMSPEQARGEMLDSQADIWSFGVVVFELLTSVSPFARRSTVDTFASVLSDSPDYSVLPPGTPPSVGHLIRRCLERDRRRRLKHIGDARLELEEAFAPSSIDASSSPALHAPSLVSNVWNVRRAAALSAAALVAGVIIGVVWLAPRPASSPVVRTIIPADTLVSTTDRSFAFTADGNSLAYISSDARQIFSRPLDALDPVVILTTAAYVRGIYPSPDGRWFGYVENNFH